MAGALRLERALGLSPTVAAVLARRGLGDPEEARRFLAAEEHHDPAGIPGLTEACSLIAGHLERGSRIAVHGDYDVDGVCSTAIVVRRSPGAGREPDAGRIPSASTTATGSPETVERLAARRCRPAGHGGLRHHRRGRGGGGEGAGLDVVVTDHHRPGGRFPIAPSCIRRCVGVQFADLCAAGVAFKLSEGLRVAAGRDPAEAAEDLDLAALATVGDLGAAEGREPSHRPGGAWRARPHRRARPARAHGGGRGGSRGHLGAHARVQARPRINAAGRMQRADAALELLLTRTRAALRRWPASSTC